MVITQHGRSSAVLIGIKEYESLIEKMEILQDIHFAENQYHDQQTIDHEDVKSQVLKIVKK